jgi:hypothetical protein
MTKAEDLEKRLKKIEQNIEKIEDYINDNLARNEKLYLI